MVSLESHAGWADGFRPYPDSHVVIKGPYNETVGAARGYGRFALALIDESPPLGPDGKETSCGARRMETFLALQDICDYLVVHDYWNEIRSSIDPILSGFNSKVVSDYEPPVLVASKTLPVPKILL